MTGTFNQAEAPGHHLYKMASTARLARCARLNRGGHTAPSTSRRMILGKHSPYLRKVPPLAYLDKMVHPNCAHRLFPYIWDQKAQAEQHKALEGAAEPFNHDPRGEAERKRYEDAQRKNRERLRDRKEWEKIKKIMPDEAPTFSGYRNMRRSGSERYNDLRYAVKVNDKLAAGSVDYTAKEWYNKHQETKAALIGLKTSDGIKIASVAHHATERLLERTVFLPDVKQALTSPHVISPIKLDAEGRPSKTYVGEYCKTVINQDSGNINTLIYSRRKGGPQTMNAKQLKFYKKKLIL